MKISTTILVIIVVVVFLIVTSIIIAIVLYVLNQLREKRKEEFILRKQPSIKIPINSENKIELIEFQDHDNNNNNTRNNDDDFDNHYNLEEAPKVFDTKIHSPNRSSNHSPSSSRVDLEEKTIGVNVKPKFKLEVLNGNFLLTFIEGNDFINDSEPNQSVHNTQKK
jgi:hypothetical protein